MMAPSTKTKVRKLLPWLSVSSLLRGRVNLVRYINTLFSFAALTEEARSEKWARTFLSVHLTVIYVLTFNFLFPFHNCDYGIGYRNL